MSETAVEESICDVCGAVVRDASVFCYNCGSAVTQRSEEIVIVKPADDLPTSDAPSNGTPVIKTAKSARVRPRKRPVQNRDVTWEEREGISISFVVTTLVLVALAVTILVAGFYFR